MANDRITQLPVEALISPTSGMARFSQDAVEVIVSPTSGKARLSQTVVEVIINESLIPVGRYNPIPRIGRGSAW